MLIESELICLQKKAWVCRKKKSRDTETQTDFQLERNTKGNMKWFHKYTVNKQKTKRRIIPLPSVRESK